MSTAPSVSSADSPVAAETCVICGRDPGNTAFCHLYREGHRLVLCSPQCAEAFLERESGEASRYSASPFAPPASASPTGST